MGTDLEKELKKHKLLLTGAATALGLSLVLYEKLKDRIEFSLEPVPPKPAAPKPPELKKLKEKEAHLAGGMLEHLKEKIEKFIKGEPEEPKTAKALRKAVLEYVTEGIEDKLKGMGLGKEELEEIVKAVHNRTEEILAVTDLGKIAASSDSPGDQMAAIIKAIRPQLVKELKRIKHSV